MKVVDLKDEGISGKKTLKEAGRGVYLRIARMTLPSCGCQ